MSSFLTMDGAGTRYFFRLASLLVFAAICAAYASIAWTGRLNDVAGDSAIYLLTAQHFSPFVATSEAARFFAETSPYPPLYPLLLAWLGAAGNLLVAHLLTAAMAVAALLFFCSWMREEGLASPLALAATVTAALLPGLLLHVHHLLTECLFMLCAALAMWRIAVFERTGDGRALLQCGFFLSLGLLTRSFAIAWIAAFAVYLLLRRPKRGWMAFLLALLPALAWHFFGGEHRVSYFAVMEDRLVRAGDIEWSVYVQQQLAALADGFNFDLVGASTNAAGAWVLGVLCFAAVLVRTAQRKLDGWAVLGSVALLVIWPFPTERVRFMLPLAWVMIGQVVLVTRSLSLEPAASAAAGRYAQAAPWVVAGLFCLTFLPNAFQMAERLTEPMPPELQDMRRTSLWYENQPREQRLNALRFRRDIEEAMRGIASYVPPGGCVYAGKPSLVGFYGGRKSLGINAPLDEDKSLQAFFPGDCGYAYLWPYTQIVYPEPFYPWRLVLDRVAVLYAPRDPAASVTGSSHLGLLVRLNR